MADVTQPEARARGPVSLAATIGLVLAILAAAVAAASGIGYRLEWWSLGTAFGLLRYGAFAGIAAIVVSLLGVVLARPGAGRRGVYRALAGLGIGVVVLGLPLGYLRTAQSVPPIHDITTDTEDPPAFVAVLPLRADAPNSTDYGGEEIAVQQRAAYPSIEPADFTLPPDQLFELALATARDEGWQIIDAAPSEGRIEATDTSLWFGFKDDVVIRIKREADGSRLDIRSLSRVGISDVGANAARIERFLDDLRQRADEAA
ncbi:MAG: DUF1499 domain-containing protein [Pseudomonadota bacterium]